MDIPDKSCSNINNNTSSAHIFEKKDYFVNVRGTDVRIIIEILSLSK